MTRPRWTDALMIGVLTIMATLSGDALGAEDTSATLTPAALAEIAQVEAEIDRIEAQTLERLTAPPDNQVQQIELLGKLMLYDKHLSVNRNEACAFCHTPETGFTGPVSELNRTTGSYPGSVRTRFSDRKPQSHAYAPLAPVLHYNPGQGDLVGGNFWDMRATGRRLGNPAAEQAQGPPTNPVEMGLPDIACAVYRASQRPYRALFETVWGQQAFAIAWPNDVEQVCDQPGPPPANDPMPVHLGPLDRGRAAATFDQMAQSIANYEASAEVTTFTSKFDAMLAGKAVHGAGAGGLRAVPRQGAMQQLPPRRRTRRGSAVHRFHRQQYRNARQSAASLLCGRSPRRTRLCRQSGGIVIRRRRRRPFSHSNPSAQPALGSGCAMASPRARQSRALSGADATQCGQAALSNLCQSLWTQWLLQEPEVDRAFLQHARCPAALPTQ